MALYPGVLTLPMPASGQYFYPQAQALTTTLLTTTGELRLAPWYIRTSVRLSRLGSEISTIGDVGSKFRLGIYADNGNLIPGSLVLDAGTINGDSATAQELTIDVTLGRGVYWLGGAAQIITTTPPTVRACDRTAMDLPMTLPLGTSIPAANNTKAGVSMTGVTGALPSTFTGNTGAVTLPRLFAKVA